MTKPKPKPKPKGGHTPATRKALERLRKRQAGLVMPPEIWVLPEHHAIMVEVARPFLREAALML